jgi:ribonuclease VapC
MTAIVLDASALLAMLRDEAGGAMVAGAIAGARMSAVNFAEVVSHFIHAGMPPDEVDAMLAPLPLIIVEADAALARMAGRLRQATAEAGLSLGDRFCLALAARDRLPAWTADRQWRRISKKIDAEVLVIR